MCVVNISDRRGENTLAVRSVWCTSSVFFLLQNELVFKPSIGIEFVTKMGVNVPEFVESAVEMHTSMYHESALQAKITMENNEVKLSIPAPEGNTRIFSMW